ncbi:MAG: hypothetical protein RI947_257 [Candidatus Parcubacteria bacterium]|jgi:hypothetical protein
MKKKKKKSATRNGGRGNLFAAIIIGIIIITLIFVTITQSSKAQDQTIYKTLSDLLKILAGGGDGNQQTTQEICDNLKKSGADQATIDQTLKENGINCSGSGGSANGGGGGDVTDIKQLITSYSLPEPDPEAAKTLKATLSGKAAWGAAQTLQAERDCGTKCLRYLVSAWMWIEGGTGYPDPYAQNCHDNKKTGRKVTIHEPCLKGTSYTDDVSGLMQVAGFQAYSKLGDPLKTVYEWFYQPGDIKPVMEKVLENSSNAGYSEGDYHQSGGLVDKYLTGIQLPAGKEFTFDSSIGSACNASTSEECQFYTLVLAKDPRMAVGLNSIGSGVTQGDLVDNCLKKIAADQVCYNSAYYSKEWAQKFSNVIAALWMFDNNKDTLDAIAGGAQGTGDGSWPYFCQMWGEWKSKTTFNLSSSGCGPTSIAMTYCKHNGFGAADKMTCGKLPPTTADDMLARGALTEGTGTFWGPAVEYIKNTLNLDMSPSLVTDVVCGGVKDKTNSANWGNIDLDAMKQHLDAGRTILASSCYIECKGCRTQGLRVSHVFTVDAVDVPNRQVHLRDPNNCNPTTGEENMSKAWTSADSFPWNVAWGVKKK